MSRGLLLDTDVLSATARPGCPQELIEWLRINQGQLYTSSISIAELSFGVQRLPAGRKKHALDQWLAQLIETMGDHILRFDTRVAVTWGKLQTDLERQAKKMPIEDSYIAAIALRHNLIIATRNTADFDRSGIETINPLEAKR